MKARPPVSHIRRRDASGSLTDRTFCGRLVSTVDGLAPSDLCYQCFKRYRASVKERRQGRLPLGRES